MNGHERDAGTVTHEHANQVNGNHDHKDGRRINLADIRKSISLPSKTIQTERILSSWNSYVGSDGFNRMLREIKISFPKESPQVIAINAVGEIANSFLKQTLAKADFRSPEFRPISFAIGWDYSTGIFTVMEQFVPVIMNKNATPEYLTEAFSEGFQEDISSQAAKKLIELYRLIQQDPSGISLIDHCVNFVRQEFRKSTEERHGLLSIVNPEFAMLGAEIAGIIYKASYSTLTNNK